MIDFTGFYAEHDVMIILFALGVITYLTRMGGYVVLTRFENIPATVRAGLEAVPIAVIATLVVPPAISAGPAEQIALLVATLACFRLSPIVVIALGLGLLVGLRLLGL